MSVVWTHSADLSNLPKLQKADFKFWADNLDEVRGYIILVPGTNMDGRNEVNNVSWEDIAKELKCVLVGCFFQDDHMKSADYCRAHEGSGQTLIDAVTLFALHHNKPEISELPFFMWGHSAGGQFNFNFTCWKPKRVRGFIVNKGAHYYGRPVNKAAREVPGIFFIGCEDTEERIKNINKVFDKHRDKCARWAICREPHVAHGVGESKDVSLEFFRACSQDHNHDMSYIGNNSTLEISPYTKDHSCHNTSWLPNKEVAEAWQQAQK